MQQGPSYPPDPKSVKWPSICPQCGLLTHLDAHICPKQPPPEVEQFDRWLVQHAAQQRVERAFRLYARVCAQQALALGRGKRGTHLYARAARLYRLFYEALDHMVETLQ